MNFSVNSRDFTAEMDLNDSIQITSSRKVYDVLYSSKNIEEIVSEIYVEGDFIFVDKNVFNLNPHAFQNIKNIMIFTAIEDNKNIESVLKLIDELYNLKFNRKN